MYNTGATALTDIYYIRTCDPDNDEAHGGGFPTYNQVVYQNDAIHRVMVKGSGEVYTYAYLGLCSKDQRAKALVYSSWPINYSVTDLSTVYTGTASISPDYTVGLADDGDIATGIIFHICSIPAHDSAVVSCAYTFLNSSHGVDSAFPEPAMVVSGTTTLPPTPGAAIYDTFFVCGHPGATTVPVSLTGATTGVWTWSSWTWAPSIGLSTTTGTSSTITLSALTGAVTYTITGNDSLPGSSCAPGNRRVMYLTVVPCFGATADSPCVGGTLHLNAIGDSAGATYAWYLGGSYATPVYTTHHVAISPVTMAAAGTYTVIRTMSGSYDTATVNVVIHPLPTYSVANNGDSLCFATVSSASDTMKLYAYPYVAGYNYSWSGPGGFSSTLEYPTFPNYNYTDTGIYSVTVTDTFGCQYTESTDATILPPVIIPHISGIHHYCTGDAFVPFGITLQPGARAIWYSSDTATIGSFIAPTVDLSYAHVVTLYAAQELGICVGLKDSITVVVDSTPAPSTVSAPPVCADSTLHLFASNNLPAGYFSWSGPASFSAHIADPMIANASTGNSGTYFVTYTMPSGCQNIASVSTFVGATPPTPVITMNAPCDLDTLYIHATDTSGATYVWNCPNGATVYRADSFFAFARIGVNDGNYRVVATITTSGLACPSLPANYNAIIYAIPPIPYPHDTAYCQGYLYPMVLLADSLDDGAYTGTDYLTWYGPNDSNLLYPTRIPNTNLVGTTNYYVTQTKIYPLNTCTSPRSFEKVSILQYPVFNISLSSPFACQGGAITLTYAPGAYTHFDPLYYAWSYPQGAICTAGCVNSPVTAVVFDSLYNDTVELTVTNKQWNIACATTKSVSVDVIPMPKSNEYSVPIVCQGDVVNVELKGRTDNAVVFNWDFDQQAGDQIVYSSSNTDGPYGVKWNNSGTKIISVVPYTKEGCPGKSSLDTVLVLPLPPASFNHGNGDKVCALDSVLFRADAGDSADYNYEWRPKHFFSENNRGEIWGRIEFAGYVTLTVSNPFGCTNSDSVYFDTDPLCCVVYMPTAFTPNGDGKNDHYRPVFSGSHKFHDFRIQNRWGQTVFESSNNGDEWDGSLGGVPQDIGTYFYYLKYDCNGKTVEKVGDFTLIR